MLQILAIAGLVVLARQTPANAAKGYSPPNDSFEIGLSGEEYQYREPDFAKLQGPGIGLDGTYTYNWNTWFVRANIIGDYYDLDYSSNGTGTQSNVSNYEGDLRTMAGYNWKVSKITTISPYLGVGFRLLFDSDNLKTSSTGAYGYDRLSRYLYAPIGVGFSFNAGSWKLRPYGEYDFLLQGWQTSYTSNLGFDNNLNNNQHAGYGLRAGLMVSPPIDFHNFSIGPYIRYWNIHESDVQTLYVSSIPYETGLEPKNNTTEYGVEASIRFR